MLGMATIPIVCHHQATGTPYKVSPGHPWGGGSGSPPQIEPFRRLHTAMHDAPTCFYPALPGALDSFAWVSGLMVNAAKIKGLSLTISPATLNSNYPSLLLGYPTPSCTWGFTLPIPMIPYSRQTTLPCYLN